MGTWRPTLAALAMGLLFGLGLIVSGMTDPVNVKGFLDVFGNWRPQLMAVLGSGVLVTWLLYAVARKRSTPLLAVQFQWPTANSIDKPLLAGAALFGAGWALAGYCPGPALVAVGSMKPEAVVFVLAMLAGGLAQRVTAK